MSVTATDKQRSFISVLLAEREMDTVIREAMTVIVEKPDFAKGDATKIIDQLMSMPKITKPSGAKTLSPFHPALAGLPLSKYAIPDIEVSPALFTALGTNTHLFLEVKEWKGTRYVRKLLGAPGSFSRVKMSYGETKAAVELLATNPLRFGKIFADKYTCCACCLAELTDPVSRATGYGPTCRKGVGL
jgi:hypothetical protein